MSEDRQFEATPQRLRRAREKGQVPHSRDFTGAGLLLLTALAAPALFRGLSVNLLRACQEALGTLHQADLTPAGLQASFLHWGGLSAGLLAPLLLLTAAGAVLLSYVQTGPLLTTYPLIPKLDKLNPAQALKRWFSTRGLIELLKSLLKVAAVGFITYVVLRRAGPQLLLLGELDLAGAVSVTGRLAWELCLKAGLVLVIIGAADYAYQRFEHTRSLRMTREEVRQENKESEGDPHIRSQRQRRRQQILRDGVGARLPQATVVITNPTHFAIALYYHPGETTAPVVVARGQGRLAARIRRLARRYGLPLREDPPLARALYRACPLGAEIPAALYRAVATILAEIQRQAQRRRTRA